MPARVFRIDDFHDELSGQILIGPIPHPFEAEPDATQTVFSIDGHPLLREGDPFEHSGASHQKPQAGTAFLMPGDVTKKGKFTHAGQSVLLIDEVPVMTLAGDLETCSDAARETACDAAVLLTEVPVLFVEGSAVLPGNN